MKQSRCEFLPKVKIPSRSPNNAGGKAILMECTAILSLTATFALSGYSLLYQQLAASQESPACCSSVQQAAVPVRGASTRAAAVPAAAHPA